MPHNETTPYPHCCLAESKVRKRMVYSKNDRQAIHFIPNAIHGDPPLAFYLSIKSHPRGDSRKKLPRTEGIFLCQSQSCSSRFCFFKNLGPFAALLLV